MAAVAGLEKSGERTTRKLSAPGDGAKHAISLLQSNSIPLATVSFYCHIGGNRAYDVRVSDDFEIIRYAPTDRPFLLYIRCGRQPEHERWLDREKPRSWDLALGYYDEGPTGPDLRAEITTRGGFNKLSSFADLIDRRPDILSRYKAVILFDDDLLTQHGHIDNIFSIASKYSLQIAQPSLTHTSPHSFRITLAHPTFLLRFTNYVEVMMPLFSAAALKTCLPTFRETASTWGVDQVWPHLIGSPVDKVAVIDRIMVRHMRPIDTVAGPFYKKLKALNIDPEAEKQRVLAKYGVEDALTTYGGILDYKGNLTRVVFAR